MKADTRIFFFLPQKIVVCRTCLIIQQAFYVRVWGIVHCGASLFERTQLVKAVKNIWKSCCLPETLLMSQGQQNPWQKDFAFNHWAQKTSHKKCTFDYFKVFFHLKKTVYACMLQLLRNIKKVGNTDAIIKDLYSWPAKRNAMKFFFYFLHFCIIYKQHFSLLFQ